MATLNEIAYNIKNLAYGGNAPKEVNISIKQIKHWIHYHRAKLIADNIDKGIMSNHILWQEISLDVHNFNNPSVRLFDRFWDIYWSERTTTGLSKPDHLDLKANMGKTPYDKQFVGILPKTPDGDFSGYFITGPNTMTGGLSSSDRLLGAENRNQYGLTTPSSQYEKGDFRNISSSEFIIPELLMLKNHSSIKDVSLKRMVYHPDIVNYGDMESDIDKQNGPQHDFIHLPMKTIDESSYSDFNRFSTSNKPHAILKRTQKNSVAAVTSINLSNYSDEDAYFIDNNLENLGLLFNNGDGYADATIISGTLILRLNGLQVSPSYFHDHATKYQILWAYDGNLRAILSNPTDAVSFRRYDAFYEVIADGSFSSLKSSTFPTWNDDKTPYPIPQEYIKDLIDRIIATEISISTKTVADELRDNVDTTKIMQYGSQVQG